MVRMRDDELAQGLPDALVDIQNVTKTFGTGPGAVVALDKIALTIATNEFFTLLGPSGCGKSTLLRLLAGFVHPDAGDVAIQGRSVLNDPPNRRPVNIVFQSYALFPHMSVAENIAFGLERQGQRGARVAARVAAMLKLVRLDDLGARRPQDLSGGQQQRVALARALAPEPKLLLLDEPLSALDLTLRRDMQIELKRIQRETGITFVLVTHDQDEALSMSDRIAVMEAGRVLQIGAPQAIYERPACRFVARFMGANVLAGALAGLTTPYAALRPDRVMVTTGGEGLGETLSGRLLAATYLGSRTICTVALRDGSTLTGEWHGAMPPAAPGDAVTCRFPRAALIPLDA